MNQPLYKAFVEDTIGGGGHNDAQARRVRARENREARWFERQAVEQADREAVLAQQAALSAQNNPYASVAEAAAARRLRVENGIGGVRGELPLPAAAHSFDNEFVL